MGEKHAQARDKKARKSEQDKHGRWGKSTHFLETRRQEKVSRQGWATEEMHAPTRDEKGRESERGKDRLQRKSTHFL
jgi:hypothetical protein